MARTNEQIIKALESGDFVTGGELNPEQRGEFVTIVRGTQSLLKACRFETKTNPKGEVSKLSIGEPVSVSADENTTAAVTQKPKFGEVSYAMKKLRSDWYITYEALKTNIEQENLETTLMTAFMTRIAADMELLAIQGDAATYAAVNTPIGYLLRRFDGWDLDTAGANVLDVGGAGITFDVFRTMYARMPNHYLADPGLKWIMSSAVAADWMAQVASRTTAAGDAAMAGQELRPLGIPMLQVPLIPNSKLLDVAAATPGQTVSTRQGDFEIVTGTNDSLKIAVDAGTARTVTLTAGVHTPGQICAQINAAHADLAGIAYPDAEGRIVLESPTTGGSSTIDIQAVANDAYTTLGFTVATYTGAAAGSGSLYEGSFLWLANPMNFMFFLLDEIRVTSEYEKDYDRFEVTAYSQIDVAIENIDAVVKGINVHRGA